MFLKVLFVFRGFVVFRGFCLKRFCVFVEVFIVFRVSVCLLRCCFCGLSSTKRRGSIFDEF